MDTLQKQVNDYRIAIDTLTHEMQIKISQKNYADLPAILSVRWDYLHKLVALYTQNIDKEALRNYFLELRERDQQIIAAIGSDRAEIEAALMGLNKIIKYTNPAVRGVV